MGRLADEHGETLAVVGQSGDAPSLAGVASGEVLAGRYQLVEMLGSGGMGTVYRARDLELDEMVALKTLRRELIDAPGALDRFRRELKLARRVTHRSVARAFDLGEHAGERFLTMELVPGPSLGRVLDERGVLEPREAVRIAARICEGLAAAHAAGVVHRDLKPDNVLLDGDRVVITDFGVARAMTSDDPRATAAGGIVGTPAYMAPEQVEGGDVDARADIFALGVLLFEAIAGRLPFEGKSALALAAARLVGRAPPLSSVATGCPVALAEVVDRALARAPSGRFESADAMRDALDAAIGAASLPPRSRSEGVAPPRSAPERRVAVVPLRTANVADDAWIAEGLADDIVDALSVVRGVRVRGRAPAPSRGEDLRDYGRRHDIEALLEGSVRREGERVRTMLRLVSVADGFQIWAHRFDSAIGELLRVGDEAAHAIAEALSGAELDAPARVTPPPEAVELYLRAKLDRDVVYTDRLGLLGRALAIAPDDPTIIAAYARQAAYFRFQPGADPALGEQALTLAHRALTLAPGLPDAHLALAQVHIGHDEDVRALGEVLLAKRYGPGLANPDDMLGRLLSECDLVPEAIAHLERALWIEPSLHFARVDLVRLYAMTGRWENVVEGVAATEHASATHHAILAARMRLWGAEVELPPAKVLAHSVLGPSNAAIRAVLATGRLDPEHQATFAELCARVPPVSRPRRLFLQIEAECWAYVGDAPKTLECVTKAVEAGLRDLTWLRRCPVLATVREQPAFGSLLTVVEERAKPVVERYRASPELAVRPM